MDSGGFERLGWAWVRWMWRGSGLVHGYRGGASRTFSSWLNAWVEGGKEDWVGRKRVNFFTFTSSHLRFTPPVLDKQIIAHSSFGQLVTRLTPPCFEDTDPYQYPSFTLNYLKPSMAYEICLTHVVSACHEKPWVIAHGSTEWCGGQSMTCHVRMVVFKFSIGIDPSLTQASSIKLHLYRLTWKTSAINDKSITVSGWSEK